MQCFPVRRLPTFLALIVFACCAMLSAQGVPSSVRIQVQADHKLGQWKPVWGYFGYDEPNYTYTPNGEKLLRELAASSPVPLYVRTHNLFTSGDGSASLKWGSTNVYSEDAEGKPVYDWKIIDRIFDTYHNAGIKPLIELGFMPQALSTHPDPYRHNFPQGSIFTGWTYPPKDYQKWAGLVFQFASHLRDRYGESEVNSWLWEVWNEPDIPYWKGSRDDYFKLYDFSADALRRALPQAHIGGPDSTGPGNARAEDFLRAFLEHCAHGRNYVTGKQGAPLDFVSFHPKGAPVFEDGHITMGSRQHLAAVENGFEIVKSFPEWKDTPVILGESDPEGCAACSPEQHPEDGYRNTSLYAAYTAEVLHQIQELARRDQIQFQGAVTWAFEFEGQPYFVGYRDLATNGIDKPELNAFRMFGLLHGDRLTVNSTGAISIEEILKSGVSGHPDVNAVATRDPRQITVLIWNYSDEEGMTPDIPVDLQLTGMDDIPQTALVECFRVDGTHSNSYTEWKLLGSPQKPTENEDKRLESAGQLQLLGSPQWNRTEKQGVAVSLNLPAESLSLVRVTW